MMQLRKTIQCALLAVLAAGVVLTVIRFVKPAENGAVVGEAAPMFRLADLQGKQVWLADFKGKGVLLNFWASWCNPCVNELPLLNEAYKLAGVEMLAINVGEQPEAAQKFVDRYELKFPVVLDPDMKVMKQYRVTGLPLTLLINADGELIARHEGELTDMSDIMNLIGKIKQ